MANASNVLVIIVNYRSAALTLRAIESLAVERQRFPELALKVVVVENASGDEEALRYGLRARASSWDDWVSLLVSPNNGGFGAGNNRGMEWSYGIGEPARYFHFLNPDTEIRPGAIHELVRFLDAHPRAGIAGSRLEDDIGTDWASVFRFPTVMSELEQGFALGLVSRALERHIVRRQAGEQPSRSDWLPGASMMVQRQTIEDVGGFDEEFFLYFEETDFALRAHRAGWETWYVPTSRVMHIAGQSTGVTSRTNAPRRLPPYWFQSRRRFFAKAYGQRYAAIADLAFVASNVVGVLKRGLKGQPNRPYMVRDLLKEGLRHHFTSRELPPERVPLRAPGKTS